MQPSFKQNNQEIISMEEYLSKRQEIREKELKRENVWTQRIREKSSALTMAELYM
ncbi:MAG: hypothetical protein RSD28_06000 [Lachnospiraceae bacterium]